MAFILLIATRVDGRRGLAEEFFITPGGHSICDCDPYEAEDAPVLFEYGDSVKNIRGFYFYKLHIIGYGDGYQFILDEKNEKLQLFNDSLAWEKAIIDNQLQPTLYTRWLDLSDSPDMLRYGLAVAAITLSPIALAILIVFIYFLNQSKNKRKLRRWAYIFLCAIGLLLLYQFKVESY